MEVTSALGDAERGGRIENCLVSRRGEGEERSLKQWEGSLLEGNLVHIMI